MRVLVIEDHEDSAEWLRLFLRNRGHDVSVLHRGAGAPEVASRELPELILVDLMLPDTDGVSLMRQLKQVRPEAVVVVMTGHGSVTRAVDAMQAGAMSFLEKPLDPARLANVLEQAERASAPARGSTGAVKEFAGPVEFGALLSVSDQVHRVVELAKAVAATDANVLISGENGTGKELIADALHEHSLRAAGTIVKINCAAIPGELIESELFGYRRGAFTGAVSDRTGLFELAKGGTLLLDEVGDMPPHLQAKLLRVLEDRRARPLGGQRDVELDFRLICATNCDLQEAIKGGRFREDLYFRINTITLKIPPLRERPEDVAMLAGHFCAKYGKTYGRTLSGFSPEAMSLLASHTWRGNVRELEHAVERAVIVAQGTSIEAEDLPEALRAETSQTHQPVIAPRLQTLAAIEKWAIQRTLEHTRGNKRAAAEILGVYRPTLYNKLRKYGIGERIRRQPA